MKETRKRHWFYPLIILVHREFESELTPGKKITQRRVERCRKHDERFGSRALHILYARQLGKLSEKHWGKKPLMELPFVKDDITCAAWPFCEAEVEYGRHFPSCNQPPNKGAKVQISGEEILDAEMEN